MLTDVVAVDYIRTNLIVTQSGGSANTFVLRLSTRSGTESQIEMRYNVALKLHNCVLRSGLVTAASAAGMPPFPGKNSFSRQTPAFLRQRGIALASYLQATLALPEVATLLEVQSILSGASSAADNGEETPPMSPVADSPGRPRPPPAARPPPPPRTAPPQRPEEGTRAAPKAAAAAAGAAGSSPPSTLMVVAVPLAALAATLAIGSASEQPMFVVGCFALGLFAGAPICSTTPTDARAQPCSAHHRLTSRYAMSAGGLRLLASR